jgi:hypothetical protein
VEISQIHAQQKEKTLNISQVIGAANVTVGNPCVHHRCAGCITTVHFMHRVLINVISIGCRMLMEDQVERIIISASFYAPQVKYISYRFRKALFFFLNALIFTETIKCLDF